MTLYCPICKSEFQNNVSVCPDDDALLTEVKPADELEDLQIRDIYAAANIVEGERIVLILDDEGIKTYEHPSGTVGFPTTQDQFLICVPEEDVKRAHEIINKARKDRVISQEGAFIGN